MGSGKSTVGARVAELAGVRFEDLDRTVETARGLSVAEIFATEGEDSFRAAERELFATALSGERVIALGGGAPMQDVIWRRVKAEAASVFLEVPLDAIRVRLGAGEGRPLAAGDLESLLAARIARYREADHTVDGSRPAGEVAQEVLRLWSV
jgi:shikimate kinase